MGDASESEHALKAYERILAPFEDPNESRELTLDFLANIELRKIYCLIDLKRYEDAKGLCESQRMREAYADQLDMDHLYDYYFCYANVLGRLGQIPEMDRQMTIAMKIAAEHLSDLEKCERTWKSLLDWGRNHQDWQYLLEQSTASYQFGANNGSLYLQWIAGESAFYALRGLGRNEEAKRGAQKILQRYQDAGSPEKVAEWRSLLESV